MIRYIVCKYRKTPNHSPCRPSLSDGRRRLLGGWGKQKGTNYVLTERQNVTLHTIRPLLVMYSNGPQVWRKTYSRLIGG